LLNLIINPPLRRGSTIFTFLGGVFSHSMIIKASMIFFAISEHGVLYRKI
jgi:hypothetical protein